MNQIGRQLGSQVVCLLGVGVLAAGAQTAKVGLPLQRSNQDAGTNISEIARHSDGGLDVRTLLERGYRYLNAWDQEQALLMFRQAEAIDPQDKHVIAAIAFTLDRLRRTAEAQKYYERAEIKYSDGGWVGPELGDYPREIGPSP